jgi:hypothetical protein
MAPPVPLPSHEHEIGSSGAGCQIRCAVTFASTRCRIVGRKIRGGGQESLEDFGMRRPLLAVILGSVIAASCSASDHNAASGSGPTSSPSSTTVPSRPGREVTVRYSFRTNGPIKPDPSAGGGNLLHGTSDYTGDWAATSTWAYANQTQAATFGAVSLGVLDGEVKGCGSGQFLLVVASVNPTPHAGWLIVPGFGTRDLAELSGSGTWQTTTGSLRTSDGAGTIRGTIRCNGESTAPKTAPLFATRDPGTVKVDATATSAGPTVAWKHTITPPAVRAATPIELSDGSMTLHLGGTWTGEAGTHLASATRPSADGGFVEAMMMRFSGTVVGCGTGSFVVVVVDRSDAKGSVGVRSWEIVPGLGTGDLTGATGIGTGTGNTTGRAGTFKGTMSCHA